MSEPRVARRLAAVLHADVVGYSRLMQADERATLSALTECRALFAKRAAAHGGRIVNAPGDSILAEFASVVDAAGCALELQALLAARNETREDERRMLFRIGVNLGDVLVDGEGIYGDGVNVAARLEALAEPGGICVSRAVRDQIRGRLDVSLEDLGEHAVKNIAQPIRVFRLRAAGEPSRPRKPEPQPERPPLSVVVLPFSNLSGDLDQEYLADGITDDLTTDLSRISGSFVIARNSAFTYKGKAVDMKQVGRDLGVAYALEGSLRRSGDRVRVNAQLIDTASGAHVWAERFDRDLGDMLALQDDITGSIARALRYELVEAEGRRSLRERPSDPRAIDFVLRAQAALLRGQQVTRENTMEARRHYEEALRLDPDLVAALAGIAGTYVNQHLFGWGSDATEALANAEAFVARAERIEPNNVRVIAMRGAVLVQQRKPEQAIALFRRVLERDPNNTAVLNNVGWCQMFLGEPAAAIESVDKALRLDPRGFNRSSMHGILGTAHLYLGEFDQAIRYLDMYREERPEHAFPCFMQAAAFALAGRLDEAHAALDAFRYLRPGVGIATLREEALSRLPKYLAMRERVYEGLRLAGLEE